MRYVTRLGIVMALVLQLLSAFADDVTTDVMSPVVSYQYPDDATSQALTDGGLNSPIVSYQYFDDLLSQSGTADAVISPVVSYQYFEWPGDDNLTFQNSPLVSYFYNLGEGSVAIRERVGPGKSESMKCRLAVHERVTQTINSLFSLR